MNPEPATDDLWDAALVKAGFVDPRNGAPSNSALATHVGSNPSTIAHMRAGTRKPKPETVRRIADALRISVRTLSEWVDQSRSVEAPYIAPPEADLLTHEERKAVDQLIRVMAASKVGVKPTALTSEDQPAKVDEKQSDYVLAQRKGETAERRRRRVVGDFEDHPQDEGPEFGA